MKRWILVAAVAMSPAVAHADEAAKRESVERLLVLTRGDSMVDTLHAQMGVIFQGMAEEMGISPSDRERFDRLNERFAEVLAEELSWDRLKGPLSEVYLKHYSAGEIESMIAFYESETGRAMIEKMPAVMAESMVISRSIVRSLLPKLEAIVEELRAEGAEAEPAE